MAKKNKNIIWILILIGIVLIYGEGFIGAIVEPQDCTTPTECNALDKYFGCSWVSSEGRTFVDCGCGSGYIRNVDGTDCILSGGNGDNGAICTEGWVKCSNGLVYTCFAGDWDYEGRCEYMNGYESGKCKTTIQRPTIGEICLESNGNGIQCEGYEKGDEWCDGNIRKFCDDGTIFSRDCKSLLGEYGVCKTSTDIFGHIIATCKIEAEPTCQEGAERNYKCIGSLSKWEKCENGIWVGKDTVCSNIPDGFCDTSTGKCDYSTSGWCKLSDTQCLQITNCKEFNIFTSQSACIAGIYLEERWCYDSDLNECTLKKTTTSECYPSNEKSKCEENIIDGGECSELSEAQCKSSDDCSFVRLGTETYFVFFEKDITDCIPKIEPLSDEDFEGITDNVLANHMCFSTDNCKSGKCVSFDYLEDKGLLIKQSFLDKLADIDLSNIKAGALLSGQLKKEATGLVGLFYKENILEKQGVCYEGEGDGLDLPDWLTKKYYGLTLWLWIIIAIIGIPLLQQLIRSIGGGGKS